MKKIITCAMLALSISGTLTAQKKTSTPSSDKVFDVPEGFLSHRFNIDLGNGNSMQLELSGTESLEHLTNIDSMLTVFFRDLAPFKDSLSDDLSSKKIDYLTDKAGRKKIRLNIYRPGTSSFLLRQGEVSALKAEQDTVNLVGILNVPARRTIHKAFSDISYYRISFFVNELDELRNYDGKALNAKVAALIPAANKKWKWNGEEWHPVKGDPAISAKTAGGNIPGRGDYLSTLLSVNMQNYKSYFMPGVTAGLMATFNSGKVKREVTAAFETNFIFDKDPLSGKLKTFRQNFITVGYWQEASKPSLKSQYVQFTPNITLSYLLKKQGDYFDKNTFRFGLGQLNIFNGRIRLEPGIYFNDFFKHATPTIKFSLSL